MTNNDNPSTAAENRVEEPVRDNPEAGSETPASPEQLDPASAGPGRDDPPEQLSSVHISELKAKAAKADENWDRYLRTAADLENYKKRAQRERADAIKYGNEALVERLLPIVDNFEAALAAASAPNANADSVKTGVNMIYTQIKNFLTETGVEEIDALDKPFDPNLHDAVSQQASEEAPEGQVLQQMRKGYKLRDRLIRPAMVVVAKKP